jgi:hypothetical protein
MRTRHERRKAAATYRKKVMRLNTATFDQHFDDVLRRARADFERTGEIRPVFECVADGESFDVPAHWPDRIEKAAACAALRDSFRRRGVNRYVFASEGWVGKTPGLRPTDDPARGECVQVIAVERNGPRRYAFAGITRNAETTTLGPWEVKGDVPQSWLFELLEDGHSDRALRTEPPPVGRISRPDFQNLVAHHPEQAAEFRDTAEICAELEDLIADQVRKDANGDPMAMFMALESVLLSIEKDMGIAKGFEGLARSLRDHPDKYPMFSTVLVPDKVPSTPHLCSCKATLRRFSCEKREVGHTPAAIFGAFVNIYLHVGSQVIGALSLADRIEKWDPAYQAKLRQVGLRSSFELDDEEGNVFMATSAGYYPIGVVGRRNAVGDLFVSGVVALPQGDFTTAVEEIKKRGFELILGSEAKELLCKMQQVKGFAMPAAKSKEIWEVEDWGEDEWAEQFLAEVAFSMAMNVQHVPDHNKIGHVAGYRVRRAPNGLVLVPSDNDEDIFVAVKRETTKTTKGGACVLLLGWLRGSEGKLPQFYQNNRWVIPPEALHDMEELPGKERLQAMPPFQEREAMPPRPATGPLGDSLEDLK